MVLMFVYNLGTLQIIRQISGDLSIDIDIIEFTFSDQLSYWYM